jgi:NADPH2:quinone reductase
VTRPTLFDYVALDRRTRRLVTALFDIVRSGRVRVEIGSTRPLTEARQAHEALEARETIGATLLIP